MDSIDAIRPRASGWRYGAALGAMLLSVVCGCGRSPYPLAPVHGRVTIDGKPLGTGKIMFAPIARGEGAESGRPAFGRLQADGSFVLGTFADNDGAIVGDHWATIINSSAESGGQGNTPKLARLAVPRKISVVEGQDNEIEIALTSRDVQRFSQVSD